MVEIGKVYYYFGLSCCFVKTIKDMGDRIFCVTCFNLYDAINLPILKHDEYDSYKERGIINNVWYLSKDNIKDSIWIPYEELTPDRYRILNSGKGRISHKIAMALPMDEKDIRDYKINSLWK